MGVDFEGVGVICGETPGVDILAIVAGFMVTTVVFLGSTEVTDGFMVLLLIWLRTTWGVVVSVTLILAVNIGTEWFPFGEPSAATPRSASTCSAPSSSVARAHSAIVSGL